MVERGAGRVHHHGCSLLEHLARVAARLASWDMGGAVILAGACHAAYGTDGFPTPLVSLTDRPLVRTIIGRRAERIVYLYACCDRADLERAQPERPNWAEVRDRFTGKRTPVSRALFRAFVDLTIANELDLLHNAVFSSTARLVILRGLTTLAHRASPPALLALREIHG